MNPDGQKESHGCRRENGKTDDLNLKTPPQRKQRPDQQTREPDEDLKTKTFETAFFLNKTTKPKKEKQKKERTPANRANPVTS